jgi:hypothetical protein
VGQGFQQFMSFERADVLQYLDSPNALHFCRCRYRTSQLAQELLNTATSFQAWSPG